MTKQCSKCKEVKPLSGFWKETRRKDGFSIFCAPCQRAYERSYQLKRRYGISSDEYDELLEKQNGVCAICQTNRSERTFYLAVDHDHVTGKVRGLLCGACNRALGGFGDNIQNLKRAVSYLKGVTDGGMA